MNHKKTASILVGLTGNLIARTKKERESIRSLRKRAARAVLDAPEASAWEGPFQSERIDSLSGGRLEEKPVFREMTELAEKVSRGKRKKDEPRYRVFRRSTPTISAQLPGSAPSWGSGAQVAFTEGPFLADNGLAYWFDFYLITRTLAVYIGNEPLPSVLVPVRISLFASSQTTYRIRGESLWIRSDLFAAGAPQGHYTGTEAERRHHDLERRGSPNGRPAGPPDGRLDKPASRIGRGGRSHSGHERVRGGRAKILPSDAGRGRAGDRPRHAVGRLNGPGHLESVRGRPGLRAA